MILLDKEVLGKSRNDEFSIYPVGDCHIGARNCAEHPLKKHIAHIEADSGALWFGGGDILDCIKPQDARFDTNSLPNWMLEGDADETREKMSDIVEQQIERAVDLLSPIASKCLGLLSGNHEDKIRTSYNVNAQKALCRRLGTIHLTRAAAVRLRFCRGGGTVRTFKMVLYHGYGAGRTDGAEPNKLGAFLREWEMADICFRGHSHNFDILPPKSVMGMPDSGPLPRELTLRYRWAANWGCWLYSHAVGESTYEESAGYPARAMLTCKAVIKPFNAQYKKGKDIAIPVVEIRAITL